MLFSAVLNNLNLNGNNISDAGAAAIGEALKGNSVLNSLSLYSNDIGELRPSRARRRRGWAWNGPLLYRTSGVRRQRLLDTSPASPSDSSTSSGTRDFRMFS